MREHWINLNGTWSFEKDPGNSGEERGVYDPSRELNGKINVPFCLQSKLSGIGETDFIGSVWYKRSFVLSEADLDRRAVLHIGACDYLTTVYVNGENAGTHKGGYVSFSFDVTRFVKPGENIVTIHAEDNERDGMIPSGKQSKRFGSYGCFYTRTTGIWQTVWLEFTPKTYISGIKYITSVENSTLTVIADTVGSGDLSVLTFFEGKPTGDGEIRSEGGQAVLTVKLTERHLWELGKGGLYDVILKFGEDTVHSYFGLRSISYRDKKFFLNGKSVFQRLVLDQGFYPEGIYTAPTDEELEADVTRSMAMGFNGARLHQKVFEERYLYHADRHGYIVWGEYPNWGLDHTRPEAVYGILPEWLEEVNRDFNHPSIVGWCPFNETWDVGGRRQADEGLSAVYLATKSADPTRPCIDTSGNFHVEGYTDIYDVHDYNQNPEEVRSHYEDLSVGKYTEENSSVGGRQKYDNILPFFVSEYGGIRWAEDKSGWGYGKGPENEKEFLDRLRGLTDALIDNPCIFALCYTQLTDVEQEQNGLYTYDRKPKFPPEVISPIFTKKAAIEK